MTLSPSSSSGAECLPPPPVSWSHVAGLQASLVGQLKGLVRGLDEPGARRESCLTLIPAYLLYLGAYYHQLPQQVPRPRRALLVLLLMANHHHHHL